MKKSNYNILLLLFGLTILVFGTACNSDSSSIPDPTSRKLSSFTIADPTGTLVLGTHFNLNKLNITMIPESAVIGNLIWSIPTATTGYSITEGTSLLSSVANNVTTLTLTVQASTEGTNAVTTTKELTFATPALASISAARTSGTGIVTVIAGETLNLSTTYTVTHTPQIASIGTLTWAVAPKTGSSASATISGTTLTAGLIVGVITLTVTSTTGTSTKSTTIDINISLPNLETLTLTRKTRQAETKAIVGVPLDLATIFDVGSTPTNADKTVIWSVTVPTDSSATGTIEEGTTMLSPTATGELTIMINSTVDNTKTAEASITVVTSVQIASSTAVKGIDLPLIATVVNLENQAVTWRLVSTTPADDGTVSITDGKLITKATTTATSAKVEAISVADTSKTVIKDIIITSTISSIDITSSGSATKGTDYTLESTVAIVAGITPTPVNTVIWTVVSTTPANDSTVSIADGKLITTATTMATSVNVQAMSNADNSKTAMQDIAIISPVTSINITSTGPVTKGTDYTLESTVVIDTGITPALVNSVTWSIVSTTPANDNTVSISSGKLITTAGTIATSAKIQATSNADNAKTAMQDIAIILPTLTSFTIADPTGTLSLSTDFDLSTLTITTIPTLAVTGELIWSIPTATAGYSIADGTSTLTSVIADVTTLSVTVQASTEGTNPKTATKEITFPAPDLASLSVARTSGSGTITIQTETILDLSTTYTVTHSPSIATLGTLVWTVASKIGSSATATILGSTLTAGTTAGDMTLTVTSSTGNTAKSDTIDISFSLTAPPDLISFTIADPTENLVLGTPVNLGVLATPNPSDALLGTLTWTIPTATTGYAIATGASTLSSVATDATTLSVTVQASTEGPNPKTATKEITFPAPDLASLSVARTSGSSIVTVIAGETLNLSTTYTVTHTPQLASIGTLTWSATSKNGSATATISSTTLTAGTIAGDVTLTVTSGTGDASKSDTIDITIIVPVTGVTVTSLGTVNIGVDYNLTATVAPATATQSVTWNITTSPLPESVTLVNGVLKTVAGRTPAGSTISITATSTADGVTSGTKVTSTAVDLTLTHELSLERKAEQVQTRVYVAGEPIDLNTVFSITPEPTGTLSWQLRQTGNLATIVASTGVITAIVAGDVNVYVTETNGGITKSSNIMPFTINAEITNPVTVWSYDLPGSIKHSSPAVSDNGTVFIGFNQATREDKGPNFIAVKDGSKVWEQIFEEGSAKKSDEVRSSPAIGPNGKVYSSSYYSQRTFVLNSTTGNIDGEISLNARVRYTSPTFATNGNVYIAGYSKDGKGFHSLNSSLSTKNWVFKSGSEFNATPAIGSDGTIYIGSNDDNFYAINPDGSEKWSSEYGSWTGCATAIGQDGTVYFSAETTTGGVLIAYNPADGTEKWRKVLPKKAGLGGPAVAADGTIYLGGHEEKMIAYNTDGTEKWRYTAKGAIETVPAIDNDGNIYFGDMAGYFHVINPDGLNPWKVIKLGDAINSSAAIGSDGIIYVATNDGSIGKIYALRTNATGLQTGGWPMFAKDTKHTGR